MRKGLTDLISFFMDKVVGNLARSHMARHEHEYNTSSFWRFCVPSYFVCGVVLNYMSLSHTTTEVVLGVGLMSVIGLCFPIGCIETLICKQAK